MCILLGKEILLNAKTQLQPFLLPNFGSRSMQKPLVRSMMSCSSRGQETAEVDSTLVNTDQAAKFLLFVGSGGEQGCVQPSFHAGDASSGRTTSG